jgi:hypothetical protein
MDNDETPSPETHRNPVVRKRKGIGIGGIVLLIGYYVFAQIDVNGASTATGAETSAIQVIQLWTPHLFGAIILVGILISLYIWTRAYD